MGRGEGEGEREGGRDTKRERKKGEIEQTGHSDDGNKMTMSEK